MSEESVLHPIVIDNGSGYIKAGFGGQDAPRCVFRTVVGVPKHGEGDTVLGDEVWLNSAVYPNYPIEYGMVTNWDQMEMIWKHAFNKELGVDPTDQAVLMSEDSLNPKANREKMLEILFKGMNVGHVSLQPQEVLAMLASGRTAGVSVNCGFGVTSVVPVQDGYAIKEAVLKSDVCGDDATTYLTKLMCGRGYEFTSSFHREIARDIKEKLCYVASNLEEAMRASRSESFEEKEYEMPDGEMIKIGSEMFNCPEIYFQPSLIGKEGERLSAVIYRSIQKSEFDTRSELYKNIVLSGGSSMFPGFAERVHAGVVMDAPSTADVRVCAPEERKYMAWIGGSILSSLRSFPSYCVTKAMYDEAGASIIHRVCP